MPLSPSDVHDKQFKLVRQTTGYDMDEVDAFLDEVEVEIARLTSLVHDSQQVVDAAHAELASAHAELNSAQSQMVSAQAEIAAAQAELTATRAELRGVQTELSAAQLAARALPESAPEPPEPVAAAAGVAEPSTLAAARLLELAQRTADEYIAAAQDEGGQIMAEARQRADEYLRDIDAKREAMEQRVQTLAGLERELKERLRGYLEGQLRDLEALGVHPAQV